MKPTDLLQEIRVCCKCAMEDAQSGRIYSLQAMLNLASAKTADLMRMSSDTQVVNMADIFAKQQDDEARSKTTFDAPLVKVGQ